MVIIPYYTLQSEKIHESHIDKTTVTLGLNIVTLLVLYRYTPSCRSVLQSKVLKLAKMASYYFIAIFLKPCNLPK